MFLTDFTQSMFTLKFRVASRANFIKRKEIPKNSVARSHAWRWSLDLTPSCPLRSRISCFSRPPLHKRSEGQTNWESCAFCPFSERNGSSVAKWCEKKSSIRMQWKKNYFECQMHVARKIPITVMEAQWRCPCNHSSLPLFGLQLMAKSYPAVSGIYMFFTKVHEGFRNEKQGSIWDCSLPCNSMISWLIRADLGSFILGWPQDSLMECSPTETGHQDKPLKWTLGEDWSWRHGGFCHRWMNGGQSVRKMYERFWKNPSNHEKSGRILHLHTLGIYLAALCWVHLRMVNGRLDRKEPL